MTFFKYILPTGPNMKNLIIITFGGFTITLFDADLIFSLTQKVIYFNNTLASDFITPIFSFFCAPGLDPEYANVSNIKIISKHIKSIVPYSPFLNNNILDITSNIGNRTYIYFNPIYVFIYKYKSTPLFLGFVVVLSSSSFNMVVSLFKKGFFLIIQIYDKLPFWFNLIKPVTAIYYSLIFKPFIEKNPQEKEVNLLDNKSMKNRFFNSIVNYIPRNFQVYMEKKNINDNNINNQYTPNVGIETILANRESLTATLRAHGRRIERNVNELVNLLRIHNITLYVTARSLDEGERGLSMEQDANMPLEQFQIVSQRIITLDHLIRSNIDLIIADRNRITDLEILLQRRGFPVGEGLDLSAIINRAAQSIARFNSMLNLEEDE